MRPRRRSAMRIATIYAVFATAWIVVTDRLAGGATSASWETILVQICKGLLFVAVTSVGLYLLVARHDRHRDEARASQERILEEALSGWAAALDLRDHSTAEHTRRVTDLTVALAGHLGVCGPDLVAMRRGATLHDIGKMGVPDAVLTKPGPLDDDEWALMRRHPEMALQFLAGLDDLESVSEIPFAHHEKYDGSGYPRGLRGDDIPYGARIFAIIDAYDALTSDRPYRSARSHVEAMAILAVDRGSHFDPLLFDAFTELMRSPRAQVHVG